MGGPRRTPGESVEALEEAMRIIRAFLDMEPSVRLDGEHYRAAGAKPGPAPLHRIGLWVGAYGPRMLRLTGRLADGWLPSLGNLPEEEIPARHEAIDEAARRAGRDPADIVRALNVGLGSAGGRLDAGARRRPRRAAPLRRADRLASGRGLARLHRRARRDRGGAARLAGGRAGPQPAGAESRAASAPGPARALAHARDRDDRAARRHAGAGAREPLRGALVADRGLPAGGAERPDREARGRARRADALDASPRLGARLPRDPPADAAGARPRPSAARSRQG